jgi:hypothetical protein
MLIEVAKMAPRNRPDWRRSMTRNSRRARRIAERPILRYHLRRGSSSPAFERLRQKYPNDQDELAVFSKFLEGLPKREQREGKGWHELSVDIRGGLN